MTERSKITWDEALGGWTVSGYDLVRAALLDPEAFSSEGNPVADNLAGEAMLVTDGAVHDAVRAIWAPFFAPGSVARWRGKFQALAEQLVQPVAGRIAAGECVDLVPPFERYAGTVLLMLFEFDHVGEERFRRWYKLLLDSSAFAIGPADPLCEARARAKAEVYALLENELDNRQARLARGNELGGDLVSLIAPAEGSGGITRRVILDNLFNAFTGGADTTVRWLGNAVVTLYRHPQALAEIRADPALLPRALEEVMRLQSVTRFAIRTVTASGAILDGQAIPPGDTVYLLTSAANRDPDVYPNPEIFDIHRAGRPHLGFSYGVHQCIGMHLARVETQAMIGALIRSIPALKIAEVAYGDTSFVTGPQQLLVCAREL